MNNHTMRTVIAVLVLFGLVAGMGWPASAQNANLPPSVSGADLSVDFKPGQLLVKFRRETAASVARSAMQGYEAQYVRTLYASDVELWQVPEGSELQIVERLNAEPFIEYAEPNYRIYAHDKVPNDPHFSKQWAHTIIKSPAAWDVTTGSTGVTIAILDTGIDPNHPDLKGKIVAGYDFVGNDNNPRDLNGHGTHVAGIAAAITNNGLGVAGTDWRARIMPIRILDDEGGGYVDAMVDGILWASSHGAKVLNLSLGGYFYSTSAQDAINAVHASSLVVASMGNDGISTRMYPAAYNNVLAVAATLPSDIRAGYSNYGDHCDVAAPGGYMTSYHDPDGIYSTMPTYPVYMTTYYSYSTNYDYVHGTSQAAPYVSGLAALLWGADLSLTPDQVQTAIETTAVDKGAQGWDWYYGHGRIDALAALLLYRPPEAPVLLPISNGDGDGTYLVDWDNVPLATSYLLQEDDHSLFSSPTMRYSGPGSQYQITGQNGGIWYYRVRASNNNGNSPWSDVQSVGVRPGAPALAPIDNPGHEDEYPLAWSSVPGALGYALEEADNPSFSNAIVRYRGTALQYNVTGQPGGTWYYRVRAYNSVGNSLWSNSVETTVDEPALPAPTLELINNDDGDDTYWVVWQGVPGATSYVLEDSRSPYFFSPVEVYSGPDTQHQMSNKWGGTWHYRVRAFGPGGKSPWSNVQSVIVPATVFLPLTFRGYEVPVVVEGIQNGDFEAGLVSWKEYSSHGWYIIIDSDPYPDLTAHSGKWLAWLGGDYSDVSYIEQQVIVPANEPFLHYWHWIASEEDTCGHDIASVRVNEVPFETYYLCQGQTTVDYTEHVVDLSAYAGQRVWLQIRVTTDSGLNSNLYVDDVSFQAGAAADSAAGLGVDDPATGSTKTGQGVPKNVER